MIMNIADLIATLVPGSARASALSMVRIETTRPVFLVFSGDASKPDYVVHVGPAADARRIHEALVALHPLVGDLVPEPLAVTPWHAGQHLQIERGVSGLPWFTIASRFNTASDRLALRVRALAALQQLQLAFESVPGWRQSVCPADELGRQAQACDDRGIALPVPVRRHIDKAVAQLQALSYVTWPWQHGDFCLNNLLVQPASIAIIDFEEFATTAVPLHDEFGLALSVHDLVPIAGRTLADDVQQCIASTLAGHPDLRPFTDMLFLHHLLWRINFCDQPNRRAIQRQLLSQLERTASDLPAAALAGC
jgi:aminoglycoside phosphotransferase (APT) family kinase protein